MKRCCSRKFVGQAVVFIVMAFVICASMYKPIIVKRSYRRENKLSVFLDSLKDQEWYEINCFDGKLHESIGKTPINLNSWSQAFERKCQILWSKFQKIYSVDVREGWIEYSRDFENKLKSWFHHKEDLVKAMKSQSLIHFRNLYTKEHTIYNPLRSKRPMQKLDKDPKLYVDEISSATRKLCDFCNYKEMTAKDIFDRIEGKHSVSAANAFKIDKWHGLMLTRRHNPSDITEEELVDLFNTTLKWFKKVNRVDKSSRFPNILWDSLPHAGASQVHPHVHGLMDTDHYYGILEDQNRASSEYHEATGNNYWEDIIEIHHALGLAKRFGDAIALTSLTSRKDNEVMLISDEPSLDLFRLLYYVIQTYYQRYKTYCHSSGMAFPAFGDMHDSSLPALIRIATRGDCSNVRSDISSLELYTIGTKSVKQCIQFYYLWKKVCPDEYRRLRIIQRKKRQCTIDQLSTNQGSQLLLGDAMDDEDATAEMILLGLSGALSDQSHRAPGSAQIEDKHNPLASDGDLVSSTSSDNRLFVCEYSECSASFNSRAALNGHIRIHGGGMGRTGGGGGGGGGGGEGGNSATPERLRPSANASSNASTYNATTLSETLEEFPCKICGKVFSKVKSRSAHMKSHRPPDAEPKKPKLEVSSPKMDCPSPLQSGLLRPPTPSSGMRGPSIGGNPT